MLFETGLQLVTQVNELRAYRRTSERVRQANVLSTSQRADTLARTITNSSGSDFAYSPRGRLRFDMVSTKLLDRIEGLNSYIKDANEGHGMVRSNKHFAIFKQLTHWVIVER